MKDNIGQNVKKARQLKGFEQKDLAEATGLHRQSISDIELGKREVKAAELYAIARFLHVSPDSLFGQSEIEAGEGLSVLWRQKPALNEKIAEFKFAAKCEEYCWIEGLVCGPQILSKNINKLPNITIDLQQFQCEDAYDLAESFRREMALGEFPASQLINVLEEFYSVKFIVDYECNASAASSRSSKGLFTLINGGDVRSRQHFSIAHELFHLITWSEDLLNLVKSNDKFHKKNEQLADAFAAGLLIPQEKLRAEIASTCGKRPIAPSDIIALAEQFRVSGLAMLYRVYNLNLLSKKQMEDIKNQLPITPSSPTSGPLVYTGSDSKIGMCQGGALILGQAKPTPKQLNPKGWAMQEDPKSSGCPTPAQPIFESRAVYRLRSKFVRLVYLACERAQISRAKAAKLLGIDLSELSEHFQQYDLAEVHAS